MEMSDDIYANVEVKENSKADPCDSGNSYEDVYENQDNAETQRPRNFKQSKNTGMDLAVNKWYRLTAVCVMMLCVLLMMAITVLWIKLNNMTTKRDQLQTSYNNLNVSRDQLQTSYNNLNVSRDQLQTSYNNLNVSRDQLQTSFNTLTTQKDELQTSYNSLINMKDQLQKQNDEFQKNVNNLVGWIFFTSKLYYISSEKKSWTESRQDCKNRGLDLMVINSKEEQEFVEKLSRIKNYGIYIGLSDRDTEGVWKWVDGTSLTTAYWSSGNGFSDNDDCVVNRYDGTDQWFDRPCTETYYWMCE